SAGKGKALKHRPRLENLLRRWEVPHDLYVTGSEEDLKGLTRQCLKQYSAIAGAGGDSTFQIMIEEVMRAGARVKFGLIGLGSSNDIPKEFDLEGLERACSALKKGRTRRVDLGCLEYQGTVLRHFLGQVTIGLGVAVNRYIKELSGKRPRLAKSQTLAGFLAVIHSFRQKEIPLRLTVESEEGKRSGEYLVADFSNIRYWATGKILNPAARPDDGRLDGCLISPCSLLRLFRLAILARTGRHADVREVSFLRGKTLFVSSEQAFALQLDGEIVGGSAEPALFREIRIRALPAALDLIC
ncbi:MAG: diacylglycerol kinase family protein, partial [Acidobacteriota bacterium]